MDKSKKETVQFNNPPEKVLERRLTPEQQADRERMAAHKATRQPLGGAPPVHIPPLTAEPMSAAPMSEQAEALTNPTNPMSPSYDPHLDQTMRQAQAQQPGPFNLLPPGAQNQPGFRQGVGSAYAANQPGVKVESQGPEEPYKPKISQQTLDSMRALEEFESKAKTTQQQSLEQKAEQAKVDVEKGAEEGVLYDEIRRMLGDDKQFNKLTDPERKKRIEGKLQPMSFSDILVHGELRQDVPVRDDWTLTFRTVNGDEDLAVKKLMWGEKGGDRYLMDKFSIMQLALALVSINGRPLPSHLDESGRFKEEQFNNKFAALLKFPIIVLADMGVQYLWFHERTEDLIVGETKALKNG